MACTPAVPGRPMGLGRVLDDGQTMPGGHFHDGGHVRHLTEQVNRDDRPGPGRHCPLQADRVHEQGLGVDITQDRPVTGPDDRLCRCYEGVGDGDYLFAAVALADKLDNGQVQGIGPVAAQGCMTAAAKIRKLAGKGGMVRPSDETGPAQACVHGPAKLLLHGLMLP